MVEINPEIRMEDLDDLGEIMLEEVGGQDVVDAVEALRKVIESKDPEVQEVAKAYTKSYLGIELPAVKES